MIGLEVFFIGLLGFCFFLDLWDVGGVFKVRWGLLVCWGFILKYIKSKGSRPQKSDF